jgi:hypothetical protein
MLLYWTAKNSGQKSKSFKMLYIGHGKERFIKIVGKIDEKNEFILSRDKCKEMKFRFDLPNPKPGFDMKQSRYIKTIILPEWDAYLVYWIENHDTKSNRADFCCTLMDINKLEKI